VREKVRENAARRLAARRSTRLAALGAGCPDRIAAWSCYCTACTDRTRANLRGPAGVPRVIKRPAPSGMPARARQDSLLMAATLVQEGGASRRHASAVTASAARLTRLSACRSRSLSGCSAGTRRRTGSVTGCPSRQWFERLRSGRGTAEARMPRSSRDAACLVRGEYPPGSQAAARLEQSRDRPGR